MESMEGCGTTVGILVKYVLCLFHIAYMAAGQQITREANMCGTVGVLGTASPVKVTRVVYCSLWSIYGCEGYCVGRLLRSVNVTTIQFKFCDGVSHFCPHGMFVQLDTITFPLIN